MKKLLFALFAVALLASCSDNDSAKENSGEGGGGEVSTQSMSARWDVSSGTSDYASFEFNRDGNYIVVEKPAPTRAAGPDGEVFFGTYTIDGNDIVMKDFGTISVDQSTLGESSASFSLKLDGSSVVSTMAVIKETPIATTSKTDLLCHTWSVIDEPVANLDGEYETDAVGATAVFTSAGTYFVNLDGSYLGNNWRWVAGSNETSIEYREWDEDNVKPAGDDAAWESDGGATIHTLTSTRLVIIETDDDVDHITVLARK